MSILLSHGKDFLLELKMLKKLIYILFLFSLGVNAQIKINGYVVDSSDEPVPFANIIFKGSIEGTISDENGKFYLETDNNYKELEVSFVGFETKLIPIQKVNTDLRIVSELDMPVSFFPRDQSD